MLPKLSGQWWQSPWSTLYKLLLTKCLRIFSGSAALGTSTFSLAGMSSAILLLLFMLLQIQLVHLRKKSGNLRFLSQCHSGLGLISYGRGTWGRGCTGLTGVEKQLEISYSASITTKLSTNQLQVLFPPIYTHLGEHDDPFPLPLRAILREQPLKECHLGARDPLILQAFAYYQPTAQQGKSYPLKMSPCDFQ